MMLHLQLKFLLLPLLLLRLSNGHVQIYNVALAVSKLPKLFFLMSSQGKAQTGDEEPATEAEEAMEASAEEKPGTLLPS